MLTLEEDDLKPTAEVETDDEFNLTPLEEVGDEESGSQVIALDTGGRIGRLAAVMPAMLDEEAGFERMEGSRSVRGGGSPHGYGIACRPRRPAGAAPNGSRHRTLAGGAVFSGLVGLAGIVPLHVDVGSGRHRCRSTSIRNMWSWQGTTTISSTHAGYAQRNAVLAAALRNTEERMSRA